MDVVAVDLCYVRIRYNNEGKVAKSLYAVSESDREEGECEIGRVEESLCAERWATMPSITSQRTCCQQKSIQVPDKICQCERVQWFCGKARHLIIVDVGRRRIMGPWLAWGQSA